MQVALVGGWFAIAALAAAAAAQEVKRTYAVRIDERVVGYQTEIERPVAGTDRDAVVLEVTSVVKVEILGASIDQHIEQTWTLDARTRAALGLRAKLVAGTLRTEVRGELGAEGFVATVVGDPDGVRTLDPERVVISPEFGWLLRRGPERPGQSVEVDYYMPEFGSQQRVGVEWLDAARELDVLGAKVRAREYELHVPGLGTTFKVFLTDDGRTVRYELPAQRMVIELAPPVLVERIERVDLTNTILAKTNADIEDPSSLTFMKVRVQVDATRAVTPESLQAPGQVFAGTVQDGRIDGVFEIRTARPDGAGATAFPVPAGAFDRAELQPFLRPEENIESDDRVIAARARELSAGAESCFAVVERLARWTHDNIAYAIPGGITAKRTMELRAGECGGHSRVLAAMLRSLGIPARTPMGGMYVPLYGGSFGQHMWTEVWLGEAIGWLPVDCTAGQPTFVDASHIRLSERLTAFQPRLVEVLDYAPRPAPGATAARRTDAWPWAAGDSWTYGWSAAGKDLGTEVVTYEGRSDGGHAFASRLELAGGRFVETMRTLVGDDGGVRSLNVERTAGVDKSTFAVAVAGGKARIDAVTPDGERSDSVDVPAAAFVLHNNSILHVALAASRVGRLADGAEVRVRAVHDEARSVLPMSLRGKGIENIEIGGRAVAAQAVAIDLVGIAITVHLDEQGRLVRYQQPRGEFTVELKAP